MIYVKLKHDKEHENLFKFGFKGYGWCEESELNKEIIYIQCEDNFKGARGYFVRRNFVEICEIQKENPCNHTVF